MGKRNKKNAELFELTKKYSLDEALGFIEKFESPKFDETINVAFRLGVDTKQADQQVRGATILPNGVGKTVKVLVFAKGDNATKAEAAGADIVGAEDLVEKISGGWMDFDKVIATPDMMPVVSRVARVLGPRGLMPNPKLGTVTPNVEKAIEDERKGKVEFRAEKAGIVHAPVGKKSFGTEKLKANIESLAETLWKLKPTSSKGAYFRSVTIAPAMSPGVHVEVSQFTSTTK